MTWFRVDDKSAFHNKVVRAGNAAWGALCRMGAYASDHTTDGVIAPSIAKLIATNEEIDALRSVGLLEEHPLGYVIHDYLEWNPSAAELQKLRQVRAKAGKKGGSKSQALAQASDRASAEAIAQANPKQTPSKGMGMGMGSGSGSGSDPKPESEGKPSARDAGRGTRIPADWQPSAETVAWAHSHGVDAAACVEEFRDYWLSVPGAKGRRASWDLTLRGRIRKLIEDGRAPANRPARAPTRLVEAPPDAVSPEVARANLDALQRILSGAGKGGSQ